MKIRILKRGNAGWWYNDYIIHVNSPKHGEAAIHLENTDYVKKKKT